MKKITSILIIASLVVLLVFIAYKPRKATCPENYPKTEKGLTEKKADMDNWINDFYSNNPNASLSDFAKARFRFYLENDCNETLSKYYEMEGSVNETEEEKIIRETIQEEIRNQAIENLIDTSKQNNEDRS